MPGCPPSGRECFTKLPVFDHTCLESCQGLVVDITNEQSDFSKTSNSIEKLIKLQKAYDIYKQLYADNLVFNLAASNSTSTVPYHSFQAVKNYFDSSTYDEIEKDVKVTLEAAVGLVGGTMGLFTGFSILSAVEIIYYLAKFFMSLRLNKADNRKKSENLPRK